MYGKSKNIAATSEYHLYDKHTGQFDTEKIINMYRLYYDYNLKILRDFFPCKMIHPAQLVLVDTQWTWTCTREKADLMEEMLRIGSFNPMFVFDNEDGTYRTYVGNHRTLVMQELIKRGKWPADRKILVFIIPWACGATSRKMRDKLPESKIKMSKEASFYFLSYKKETNYPYVDFSSLKEKDLNKGVGFLSTDIMLTYYKLQDSIPHLLSPVVYQYRLINEEIPEALIPLSRFMNEEEAFQRWMEEAPDIGSNQLITG